LLGVQFQRQSKLPGRVEDPRNLPGRKSDTLAKAVNGVDQALAREGRKHLVCYEPDVSLLVAVRLRRQGVGAEERRRD
jgi:hypothetical protein